MRAVALLGYTLALSLLLTQVAFADLTIERKKNDLIVEFKGPNGSKVPDVQKVVTDFVTELTGTKILFSVESKLSAVGVTITFSPDGEMVTAPGGMTYRHVSRGFFANSQISSLGHSDDFWFEAIKSRL